MIVVDGADDDLNGDDDDIKDGNDNDDENLKIMVMVIARYIFKIYSFLSSNNQVQSSTIKQQSRTTTTTRTDNIQSLTSISTNVSNAFSLSPFFKAASTDETSVEFISLSLLFAVNFIDDNLLCNSYEKINEYNYIYIYIYK